MAQTERPNLIFCFPDQLGAAWLGCYGNTGMQTPHIDRFAGEGLLFERAYTASPVCTPFRGTLFTGRYPCQTGITENGYRIPPSEIPLAEHFNREGYHTAYVGKWHLSGPPGGNRWIPPQERAGFRTFVGWESHHVDHWQGKIWRDQPDQPLPMPGHETDALTDIACQVMEELEPPFCLFVAYQAPHPPCAPPPEFLSLYEGREPPLRPNVTDPDLWYYRPEWNADYDRRTFVERYCGEISHFDSAFGQLLDQIEALGRSDDTIVILTSDHGEMAGSQGRYSKGVMYDEAIRVPLIVRHPGGPAGQRTESLFSSIDLYPTLLDLCGLPAYPSAEGVSHGATIQGQLGTPRDVVFIQYHNLCIIRDNHKLVTDLAAQTPTALYDCASDPYEQHNLIGDPACDAIAQGLLQELSSWLADVQTRAGDTQQASLTSLAFQHRMAD